VFIDTWHVECCKCGKLWPPGRGYRAKNVLNEDIPKGWKLGKDWDKDDDVCPGCQARAAAGEPDMTYEELAEVNNWQEPPEESR